MLGRAVAQTRERKATSEKVVDLTVVRSLAQGVAQDSLLPQKMYRDRNFCFIMHLFFSQQLPSSLSYRFSFRENVFKYYSILNFCVRYVCTHAMAHAHVEARGRLGGAESQLRPSGLCHKHLYPLSHLDAVRSVFLYLDNIIRNFFYEVFSSLKIIVSTKHLYQPFSKISLLGVNTQIDCLLLLRQPFPTPSDLTI